MAQFVTDFYFFCPILTYFTLLFLKLFYFVCMGVFHRLMSVFRGMPGTQESQNRASYCLKLDDCKIPCGCWKLNQSFQEEQQSS